MNRNYIIIGALVVIAVILFFFFKPQHITNSPPKNSTIIAFGDSLVQGIGSTEGHDFVSVLGNKLRRPIENLGISGETSEQGLNRVDAVMAKNPGTVLVLFGGNDYLRKVPQEETFRNLKTIITKLQGSGAMVVLLGIRGGLLGNKFKASFKKLAGETGVVYVPDVLDGLFGNDKYMSDSVHPNDLGYGIIAEKIYKSVKGYIK